jgi:hypothetical protein
MNPPPLTTKRTLKRVAPLSAGKVLALLYGAMGLIAVPFFLLMAAMTANLPPAQRGIFAMVGTGVAICMPFFYAALGFIFGVLSAAIYNLAAKWVGGIEVEVA